MGSLKREAPQLSKFGYKDFIPMLKGAAFDADEWTEIVVKSRTKYAFPVTEHADSYSLWDSAINPINSVKTGSRASARRPSAKGA